MWNCSCSGDRKAAGKGPRRRMSWHMEVTATAP
jgi:hypothetical protein